MFQRILVPLDGSAHAEYALPVAARLVRAVGGTLILVGVVTPTVDLGKFSAPEEYQQYRTDEELAETVEYLKRIAALDQLVGIKVEIHALMGKVAPTLLDELGVSRADLVILCRHGFHGLTQWAHGSVTHKLVHHSPVPLLVLREDEQEALTAIQHPLRVLVTLDGSLLAETALPPAANLVAALTHASSQPGQIQLLRVVDIPSSMSKFRSELTEAYDAEMRANAKRADEQYLAAIGQRFTTGELADYHLDVTETVTISLDVAGAIVQTTEQDQADIIAMATHGRGGVLRWTLGSITERVLHAARKPVLIVRAQTH